LYVNPATAEAQLPVRNEPQPPDLPAAEPAPHAYDMYRFRYQGYQAELEKYRKVQHFITRIQETVSTAALSYTVHCDSAYAMLVKLKARYAPTDSSRRAALIAYYCELQKSPKSKDIECWLDEWERVYHDAAALNLPDVADTRATHDFLNASSDIDVCFHTYWSGHIETTDACPSLYDIVGRFRKHQRQNESPKPAVRAAFPTTFQGKPLNETKEKAKAAKPGPTPCVCGLSHQYRDCWYLVETKRPADWKPRAEVTSSIEEKLRNNEKLRRQVERAHSFAAGSKQQSLSKPSEKLATFVAVAHVTNTSTMYANEQYALKASFLLDSGATTHVCNDRCRFKTLRQCSPSEYLLAGTQEVPVQGVGEVEICVETPDGISTITLTDVAYVPSFLTSLASLKRFMAKGIHWNTEAGVLTFRQETFCKVLTHHGQSVLEYNPVNPTASDSQAAFPTCSTGPRLDTEGTTDLWHRRLGHLHAEAVEKLPTAAAGVMMVKGAPSHCEPCHLAKSKELISRRPYDRGQHPFARVHFDLIQFSPAYNGDKWAMHFLEDFSRMNFVYTFTSKDQTTATIQSFATFVKRQFNTSIQKLRTDGESSLGSAFHSWISVEGIDLEVSAPYTQAQNGATERSGGVLLSKARTMRIEAQLPQFLWPEAIMAAGYLTNRSPTRLLNWATPVERFSTSLSLPNPRPYLGHLRAYGCRAYAHIPEQLRRRLEKLALRAHIGYLVGYASTNIFRIWIPMRRQVCLCRNVTFDESQNYADGESEDKALREHLDVIIKSVVVTDDSDELSLLSDVSEDTEPLYGPFRMTETQPNQAPTPSSSETMDEQGQNLLL
jgi:hypothetical protein